MRIAAAAVALTALFAAMPAFAGEQDFTLVNATGYTVSEVYVSPARAKDWEEDVLGADTLGDDERVNIHFARDTDACIWDLKVVYDDGDTAEWSGFNLCEVSTIAISYDRKSGRTWAEYE